MKNTAIESASQAALDILSGESPKNALNEGLTQAKDKVAKAIHKKVKEKTEKTNKRKRIHSTPVPKKKSKNYNLLNGNI